MELIQHLEKEEQLFNDMFPIFEKIKEKYSIDLTDLQPYQEFIDMVSLADLSKISHDTARLYAGTSRFINAFLKDLYLFIRDHFLSNENKGKILDILQGLISRLENYMNKYYSYYYETPESRWYEYDYDKLKYYYKIPHYYDYPSYYATKYPVKRVKKSLQDEVWNIITSPDDDSRRTSRQFVPCSFPTNVEQYQQYCLLKVSKELKEMKNKHQISLEEEQESRLSPLELKTRKIAEGIIIKKVKQ
jgi:hypothetical protein